MQKIGIESTVKVIDRAPYFAMMRKGEYDLSIGNVVEIFDWDDAYYVHFHSGEIGKNNYSRYGNKEVDGLLEKARATIRWEERAPLYRRVIEIVHEDLPILFLAKSTIPVAFRDYVKGFEAGAGTWFGYYGGGMVKTWLDK